MATRPSPRSSDGTRPRSKSGAGTGRPPSSPRSSDPPRPATGRSSASTSSDKPMPSFLRPTVSSSLHSSSSSSSLLPSSSSSKGPATMARRSADKAPAQPLGAPRPITPKDKAKAPASSSSSSSSASRWSVVSPRQLMQKASNAIKATSKSRGKSKEVATPAASASRKEGAGASVDAKSVTARSQPVKERQQQPETPAEPSPAVQAEPAVEEPKAAEQSEQHVVRSQDAATADVSTMGESGQEEQVSAEQPKGEAEMEETDEEEKTVPEEVEAVKVASREQGLEEDKSQSSGVAEIETEAQKKTEDELPAVVVEEIMAKGAATSVGEDEVSTSTVEEKVVEETKAEERQQEEALKPHEVTENSEASVISEEPKEETSIKSEEPKEETSVISEEAKEETRVISEEPNEEPSIISEEEEPKEETSVISEERKEDPAPVEKQEGLAEEAKVAPVSSASAPTTPQKEAALEDVEAVPKQVSASEPVTPVAEAISEDKAIETVLSASAPETPANAIDKNGVSKPTTTPEESKLTFKGSKVKTAMEKRSDEEQPKKKEVARSNDVIEEAKSKLLEKRKSKVKALVGAFETVMDSPGKSS